MESAGSRRTRSRISASGNAAQKLELNASLERLESAAQQRFPGAIVLRNAGDRHDATRAWMEPQRHLDRLLGMELDRYADHIARQLHAGEVLRCSIATCTTGTPGRN